MSLWKYANFSWLNYVSVFPPFFSSLRFKLQSWGCKISILKDKVRAVSRDHTNITETPRKFLISHMNYLIIYTYMVHSFRKSLTFCYYSQLICIRLYQAIAFYNYQRGKIRAQDKLSPYSNYLMIVLHKEKFWDCFDNVTLC